MLLIYLIDIVKQVGIPGIRKLGGENRTLKSKMIECSGNLTTVSALQNGSYSDPEWNGDGESTADEVDADYVSRKMDSAVMDACHAPSTTVSATSSSYIQIRPVTNNFGPVTYNQYSNHYSGVRSQEVHVPGVSQNCTAPSTDKVKPTEEPEPDVKLAASRENICHAVVSSLSWKARIIVILILALTSVVILNFTVLGRDSGQGPLTTTQSTEPAMKPTKSPPESGMDLGDDIHIFTKKRWGGREIDVSQNGILAYPIPLIIVGHTAGGNCTTKEKCFWKMQDIQSYTVTEGKWLDTPYNFLIGGDGNIYQALGWDIQNPRRNNSLWVSFVGNYVYDHLNNRQEKALHSLLRKGIELGKIDEDYRLIAHCQFSNTLSPGRNVLEAMKWWPHYDNRTYT